MRKQYRRFQQSRDFSTIQLVDAIIKARPQLKGHVRVGYEHGSECILFNQGNKVTKFTIPMNKRTWNTFKPLVWTLTDKIMEVYSPVVKSFLKGDEMSWEKQREMYKEMRNTHGSMSSLDILNSFKG